MEEQSQLAERITGAGLAGGTAVKETPPKHELGLAHAHGAMPYPASVDPATLAMLRGKQKLVTWVMHSCTGSA
eukprot:gene7074-170_t